MLDNFQIINFQNKSQLIFYIAENLKIASYKVKICSGDGDTEIASSATDIIITGDFVKIRVNDTDVIVILLYFYNDSKGPIISQWEYVRNGQKQIKLININ